MIIIRTLTANDIQMLQNMVPTDHPTELLEFEINPKYKKVLIYPTDDVYLRQHQFDLLSNYFFKGNQINIIQSGDYNLYKIGNTIYTLKPPFDFNEYMSIQLDSINMIYPDSQDWLLLVDEERWWGWAVFCGDEYTIEKYKEIYPEYEDDNKYYLEMNSDLPLLVNKMERFLK